MPPSYTLYTPAGSFRAFAPLIAAEINHVNVTVETENVETIAQLKSPTGQLPILEFAVKRNSSRSSSTTASLSSSSSEGVIFSSAAIARYLAGVRTDTCLMGRGGFLEKAMINQWVDWCGAELELPSCILVYPLIGYMTIPDPEMYVGFVIVLCWVGCTYGSSNGDSQIRLLLVLILVWVVAGVVWIQIHQSQK